MLVSPGGSDTSNIFTYYREKYNFSKGTNTLQLKTESPSCNWWKRSHACFYECNGIINKWKMVPLLHRQMLIYISVLSVVRLAHRQFSSNEHLSINRVEYIVLDSGTGEGVWVRCFRPGDGEGQFLRGGLVCKWFIKEILPENNQHERMGWQVTEEQRPPQAISEQGRCCLICHVTGALPRGELLQTEAKVLSVSHPQMSESPGTSSFSLGKSYLKKNIHRVFLEAGI